MMKKTIISNSFMVVLVAILSVSGCSRGDAKKSGVAVTNPGKALSVKVAPVMAKAIERSVEATGTLLPWDEVTVGSEVPGIMDKILVDLGDSVKAGDTLAVLDQREAKLNLEEARAAHQTSIKTLEKERARLEDARTTLKRYDELYKKGVVSESQHDSARTQFDVSDAQVKEAEARVEQSSSRLDLVKKRLADTVIKSPLNGEIKKRNVSPGETIKDKTPLFVIVSTDRLKFRGTIGETSVPLVKTGQLVSVSVEAFKDMTFTGKLKRISPAVDAETRTLELEAEISNPKGVLKPGFFAKGMILTNKEEGVPFVPESAVYSFVGITKIFVISEGVAREHAVKTGVRDGDMIEVLDRLKAGDLVATTNLSNLFEGAKVNSTSK